MCFEGKLIQMLIYHLNNLTWQKTSELKFQKICKISFFFTYEQFVSWISPIDIIHAMVFLEQNREVAGCRNCMRQCPHFEFDTNACTQASHPSLALVTAVKLALSIQRSLWGREVVSLSPVSSDALEKIECA